MTYGYESGRKQAAGPIDENYLMPFGKNKGRALKDIDTEFLKWALKENVFNGADPKYGANNQKISKVLADLIHKRQYELSNPEPPYAPAIQTPLPSYLQKQPLVPAAGTNYGPLLMSMQKKLDFIIKHLTGQTHITPEEMNPDEDVPF